ncbi:acyltransferase family protein [Fictibacillus barbaricus]|uniref:Peptidoglycan/LPS O-acetylase OafA/YrhL n=1 Tax=Fictibacillus barbaricus TaxID=182136 RepID=A0ABU1U157_9BACL|nr:acyltransferase [Fictibacillus barbaricus]MDR7073194.1 peptidoglycan/LPS O-acetylase OafA/YrhL [Fictibacillus barbaricus]
MSGRIHSLDSLRGISALIVLIHHCLLMTPLFYAAHYNEPYNNWVVSLFDNTILHTVWAGSEAVLLFFVLSGFVLALPFLSFKNNYSYGDYIIKRICRIYIPYISVMTIAVLLMVFIADYHGHTGLMDSFSERRWAHPLSLEAAISYIIMLGYDNTNVNGPTWSLVHEMRISFFFPFLMLLVIKFDWKKAIILGFGGSMFFWLVFYVMNIFIDNGFTSAVINSFKDTFFYTTFFIIGALFAKNYKNILPLFNKIKSLNKIFLFLIALILFNFEDVFPFFQKFHGIVGLGINLGVEWIAAIGVLIIFTFAISSQPFNKLLTKPVFKWLGKVSYSLYLVHMVVLITMMYTLGKIIPVYIALSFVPIISILFAAITHKFIEKPAQNLGNYLVNKKKRSEKIPQKQIV